MPTHVHKCSFNGADYYQVGTYSEGAANTTGTWGPTPGVQFNQTAVDYSAGHGGCEYCIGSVSLH
jgi:hypothetical protein